MPKTVKNVPTVPASPLEFYETLAIDPADRERLESSAAFIHELGRRTTEQAFEFGDHLNRAAEVLPEGSFDKWVKSRCGLVARSARNFVAVYRNLSPYRDELVDLSVGLTALFHLSSATPAQIEEAITFAEEHGRLQVADVKTILSGGNQADGKAETNDLFLRGGVAGLKALIALKTRDGMKSLIAHLGLISQIIQAELAKKRVIKEGLAKGVSDLARVTRLELESLALFVDPNLDLGHNARVMPFPAESPWARVNGTLQRLGSMETWPKAGEMRGWLEHEVLPILDWTLSKERKPEWPLAGPDLEAPARTQIDDVPPLAHDHVDPDDADVIDEEVPAPAFAI
ncbi:hypothetical protein C8J36_12210 [Rhizobium sp. PP-F2F-G48]|uniref:hypothetical protein n=1 Tax=Rhizobium sp. PP-F2F-G48 TaxID=2135651 RepID=UPI0010E904A7|nr:hypothetical protein [Rhizobium sp. PP-F2F-G48]TCM45370.1 hypothetical protein C8J36_12210 [Rhizobium sp. PP-F2F-G48]